MKENFKKLKKLLRRSRYLPFLIVFFIVVLLGFFLVRGLDFSSSNNVSANGTVNVEQPRAQMKINKVMQFPIKDSQGEEVAKLRYEILGAELRDQIIVKGQKATAIDGKAFLIINLKITNDFDKTIEAKVRNYIRLEMNSSKEQLAPEIHNDPVEVQAVSTKYTRVAFPINDTDKDLTLYVGEIGGAKEEIKLNLK